MLAGVGWFPSVVLHYIATLTYVFVAGASYMFVALMKQALISEPLADLCDLLDDFVFPFKSSESKDRICVYFMDEVINM